MLNGENLSTNDAFYMTKYYFILLLVVEISFKSGAQTDTSFWFAAPDISNTRGDFPVILHFQTYDQPSVIYVRQPASTSPLALTTTLNLNAFSIFTLNITPSLTAVEASPINTVTGKGIYISSKENISVYYTIGNQGNLNKEMISLKGRRGIGMDFYASIPTFSGAVTDNVADGGIGFDVVATQTGVTTVVITPKAYVIGHAKNMTFVRTLTKGQTFSVLDTNSLGVSELAGSIISADQPVAVTVKGSLRLNGINSYTSTYTDQILPAEKLGRNYIILKGDGLADAAFMLAPQNATSFTVTSNNTNVTWLINSMETYSINITDPITYIRSDKPVYVFHLSGYGRKLSGAQLAPVFCAGTYSSAFTRLTSDSLNLNIWTRSGYESTFTLTSNSGNVLVPASSFSAVPGSGGQLVAARIYYPSSVINAGSYNILSNSADLFGLSVRNGGSTGGSAYAQASDFDVRSFARANSAPTATICGNTQFTLNGVVGGGPLTGAWSVLQGYGTLSGGNTQLTNNVYTPSLLDTLNNSPVIPASNRYVKIILNTSGVCPMASDTLKLHVKQPPIVAAGTSSAICANNPTVQLNGNVYGAANAGVWQVLAPGSGSFSPSVNLFTPMYHLSAADTVQSQLLFVLTSTNNGGCNPVNDTVKVFVNKPPNVLSSSVSPVVRCGNNASVSLNGSVSGTTTSTGIWQTSGSGVFIPNNVALSTNYVPSVADISLGSVWLTLESTNNNLCYPVKDSMQVLFTAPSYANAGADVNSCMNDPRASLNGLVTGTVTNTGIWSGGNGTFVPAPSALTATYIGTPAEVAAGFVNLTLSSTNNGLCSATTDQVKVVFQAKPIANFTANTVCLHKLTTFNDKSINPAGVGSLNLWTWDFGDGSAPSSSLNPTHLYGDVGIYPVKLIVRNSYGCYDTVTKAVGVYALPAASFAVTRSCSGSSQLIGFEDKTTLPSGSTITPAGYYWDFGGYGFSTSKDTSIIFPSEGFYSITHVVTTSDGCQSTIITTVNVTPRPVARFVHINNSVPGLGATVQFRDTSLYASTWYWDFSNGETSTVKNPLTTYEKNGIYNVSLTITDQFGCPSTYTADVKIASIISEIMKLIPNIVTPNDDGKNDSWRLDFIDVFYPNAEIEIFNRWGMKIFRSVGYSNAWDGSYLGDPLPVGAYFYTINLNDGVTPVIKGTVTLIK